MSCIEHGMDSESAAMIYRSMIPSYIDLYSLNEQALNKITRK